MHPKINAGDQPGFVFKGNVAGTYCFVPEECVDDFGDGGLRVDEIKYFNSGWSVRNRRWTDAEAGGAFLFPDPDQIVDDLVPAAPGLSEFLGRLSRYAPAPGPDDQHGAASA